MTLTEPTSPGSCTASQLATRTRLLSRCVSVVPTSCQACLVELQDLSYLGRPLERTIILDTDPSHFQLQPSNGILLTPWKGTRDDTTKELVSLIPFLEALAIKSVKDVRPVIQYYEGKHIPTAYAEAEAKAKKALVDKWEADKQAASSGVAGWISAALGSLVKVRFSGPGVGDGQG